MLKQIPPAPSAVHGDIAEPFVELVDNLYDLLADASDAPVLQAKLQRLIQWAELHLPEAVLIEEDDNASLEALPIADDYTRLIASQARLQMQQ